MQTKIVYHPKIASFMSYLERLTVRPALEELVKKMQLFDITEKELGSYVQYHDIHHKRNLIFENEFVQLLCICWKSGQKSRIHDHASSICVVKVITGIASETVFTRASDGYITPLSDTDFFDKVIGSEDSDIHQLSNLQDENVNLVTLHCYSPPLKKMKVFSLDSKLSQDCQPLD